MLCLYVVPCLQAQETDLDEFERQMDIVCGNDVAYQGRDASLDNRDRVRLWLKDGIHFVDRLSTIGMTSFQPYVKWSLLEPQPGQWDFSYYDVLTESIWSRGLRWTPFIILGPAYSVPDWFKESNENVFAVCMEHNLETRTQSIWNPHVLRRADMLMAQISEHWNDASDYESVLLGISGDFGEAIYPVSGNMWTYFNDPHSNHPSDQGKDRYHTHPGFWCGDTYAIADFQKDVRTAYGRLDVLNELWNTQYSSWDEVRPVPRNEAASDEAWLWQVEWYRQSMNNYAEDWLRLARRYFPYVKIFLVTGGDMSPEHGSDFSGNAEVCAWTRTGTAETGIRITNEASNYPANFVLTRLVASSCRFYGVPFGLEPAGPVDEKGVVARIYNAVTSGADHLFEYGNPIASPLATERFNRYRQMLEHHQPKIDVAVVYPTSALILNDREFFNRYHERARNLRSFIDYDFVDERMIDAGALERYKVIVRLEDGYMPRVYENILDRMNPIGNGTLSIEKIGLETQNRLDNTWPLSSKHDGVFVSKMTSGEVYVLNMNEEPLTLDLYVNNTLREAKLDPVSITILQ